MKFSFTLFKYFQNFFYTKINLFILLILFLCFCSTISAIETKVLQTENLDYNSFIFKGIENLIQPLLKNISGNLNPLMKKVQLDESISKEQLINSNSLIKRNNRISLVFLVLAYIIILILLLIIRKLVKSLKENTSKVAEYKESSIDKEKQFHLLFDLLPHGGEILDVSGKIVECNRYSAQMLGYSISELIGKHITELLTSESKEIFKQKFPEVLSGKRVSAEITMTHKNGSTLNIQRSAQLLTDNSNKSKAILALNVNVTDQKKAEIRSKESEKLLNVIAENYPNSFVSIIEKDMTFGFNSGQEFKKQNLNPKDYYGLSINQVFKKKSSKIIEYLESTFEGKEQNFEIIINNRILNFQTVPLYSSDGSISRILSVAENITERKQYEKRLEKLNQLHQKLIETYKINDKMKLITDEVLNILNADFTRIWLIDKGDRCDAGCIHAKVKTGPHVCIYRDKCLHLVSSSGRYTHLDGEVHQRVPYGCYKIGRVAASEDIGFLTNDVAHDERVHNHNWAEELGLVSFAGYRLQSYEGETIGVLALFSKNKLSKTEESLLQTICNITSKIIQEANFLDKLKKNEKKFRTLTENLSVGIFRYNSGEKGAFIEVNPAFQKIFGFDNKNDLLELNISSLFVNQEDFRKYRDELQQKKMISDKEFLLMRKDGAAIFCSLSVALIKSGGKIDFYDGIVEDISLRIEAEEKAKQKTLELENHYKQLERQRIANLVVLNDLNNTTKELKLEISERIKAENIQATLFNISDAINTTDNLDQLFSRIRDCLGAVLDTRNLFIALYDEEKDMISLPFQVDENDNYKTFPAGKTLTKYVIKTEKSLFAPKMVQNELLKNGEIEIIGSPSEIWLGVPMKIKNSIIGVIVVQSYDSQNLYSENDIELLSFTSEEIALAINRKKSEEHIKRDLEEKSILLQELYHRTKNNMQVIAAMLKMQIRNSNNDFIKTSYKDIINKISAMSLVHQKLYESKDLSQINLKEYIEDIIKLLRRSFGLFTGKISLKLDLKEIFVLVDSAIPFGLILNELVTNAFKHAFPDNREGEIIIVMYQEENEMINIQVHDNGIGVPDGFNPRKSKGMGIQTVFSLVEYQLKGQIRYDIDGGFKWHFRFKDNLHKRRI